MSMKATETNLNGVYIVETPKFEDDRGFFIESFNLKKFRSAVGDKKVNFVQDNYSESCKGVLRGLHYQVQHPQGKLDKCLKGAVSDVAVDIRTNSSTFGKWFGITLDRPELQLWVPPGLAHGFYALTDSIQFYYKTTDYYYPEYDRSLLWSDPTVNVDWKLDGDPILSEKDKNAETFADKFARM